MTTATMPAQTQSTITRSWSDTLKYLIGGLVSLAISVALFMTIASGPVTVGIALIPGVLGLLFLFMAIGGGGVTQCPGCSKPMHGLSTKNNDGVYCESCHLYFEGKAGKLWQTDESRVADSPTFASPLPESFTFPDTCCVCGNAATHREKVSLRMTNATSAVTQSTIGVTTTTTISVEVPHCDAHKEGALLTGATAKPHIKFRSYPYLRSFCSLNQTTPG